MKHIALHATCALAFATLATDAAAESIASSAASSASLTASSASQSFDSSRASSPKGNTAAAGEYRIEAVTAVAEQPGRVRVALVPIEPTAERQGFAFTLPQPTFDAQGLARGDAVAVRERPYGFEFARGDTRQAFFLVLADAWHRELDARPVGATAAAL